MSQLSSKRPTIQWLISQQKQQLLKFTTSQPSHSFLFNDKQKLQQCKDQIIIDQLDCSLDNKSDKNQWNLINDIINEAKQQVKLMRTSSSQLMKGKKEHDVAMLKIEVQKNKVKQYKLSQQKKKVEKQCQVQQTKLNNLLIYLQQLQMQIANKNLSTTILNNNIHMIQNQQQENSYLSIQSLLDSISSPYKQSYLQKVKNSHYASKPVQFFNYLVNDVMRTDKEIRFLQGKKLQEEEEIQRIQNQYKKLTHCLDNIEEKLKYTKKQEQLHKKQLSNIQKEINSINRPQYIEQQLKERIQFQENNYQIEIKLKHVSILKLCKLIETSGDQEDVLEVQKILEANRIVK